MRIALLIAVAEPGGLLRVTESLADGLSGRGHDVTVVSVTGGRPSERADAMRRWDFATLGASRIAASGPRMRRLLEQEFDVVVVAQFYVGVVLSLVRPRRSTTAVVWVEHSSLELWRESTRRMDRLVERLARRTCRRVEVMASVSHATTDAITRDYRRLRWPAIFLPNPVLEGTEPCFGPSPGDRTDRRDVVVVGRLDRGKRVDLALEAFASIRDRVADDLVIIGDGPEMTDLHRTADRLGIRDRVTFTGFHPDPPSVMDRFATLVLASEHEGLSVVIIEGLAHGCDIVSTDCPTGPRELLDDGRFGRLVPVGDVAGLSRAIEESLVDPRCTRDGLADHLRRFTIAEATTAYEAALEMAIDRRRVRLA